jgi:hypothetical protein
MPQDERKAARYWDSTRGEKSQQTRSQATGFASVAVFGPCFGRPRWSRSKDGIQGQEWERVVELVVAVGPGTGRRCDAVVVNLPQPIKETPGRAGAGRLGTTVPTLERPAFTQINTEGT